MLYNEKKRVSNFSIAASDEMQSLLKTSAKKMGISTSELIRQLVTKYLDLIVNDGDEIPILIRIPSYLRGSEKNLLQWLQNKNQAIVKSLK